MRAATPRDRTQNKRLVTVYDGVMRDFFIVLVVACVLASCAVTVPSQRTSSEAWDHESYGSCRDVMVALPSVEPAACPHRDHFTPGSPVARSTDGNDLVVYFCVCSQ